MAAMFQEIRPSIETLEADIQPSIETVCPVEGCDKTFKNSSHLSLHKAKVHGIEVDKLKSKGNGGIPCHYHCPVFGCYYLRERHFANYKLLKKHYGSIHGGKKFTCSKCQKAFGFDHARKRHEGTCGVIYKCHTCDCPYTTKEALMMHCTRKLHELPDSVKETMRKFNSEKSKNICRKQTKPDPPANKSNSCPQPCVIFVSQMDPQVNTAPGPLRQILPKPMIKTVIPMTRVTVNSNKISVEKFDFPAKQTAEIQTDIYGVSNPLEQRAVVKDPSNLHLSKNVAMATTATQVSLGKSHVIVPSHSLVTSSTGMQTNLSILSTKKRHCSIAETQTPGDLILKSAMASADIPFHDLRGGDKGQRSPRARGKAPRRRSLKTSEVQTRETYPPRKKKRRRNSGRQMVAAECNTDNIGPLLPPALPAARTEQMSTQTQKSFLEEFGHYRQQPVQNSETQTSLSTLFKNMRESLLMEENPAILSDLGLTFSDAQEQSVVDTGCGPGTSVIDTGCGPGTYMIDTGCGPRTSVVDTGCGPRTSVVDTGCGPETSVIDTGCGPRTSVVDTGCGPGTSVIDTGCGPRISVIDTGCGPRTSLVKSGCGPGMSLVNSSDQRMLMVDTGCDPGIQMVDTGCGSGTSMVDTGCGSGTSMVDATCGTDAFNRTSVPCQGTFTQTNAEPEVDFLSVSTPCFLELLEGDASPAPTAGLSSAVCSDTHQTRSLGSNSQFHRDKIGQTSIEGSDDNADRRLSESPLHQRNTHHGIPMTPPKHMNTSTTDTDPYTSSYSSSSSSTVFGRHITLGQSTKEVESLNVWNPCLASTAAKHIHTQTMLPRSVDFGAQTPAAQSQTLDFLDSHDNPHMEGQGPMLSSSASTDMHTQTADDLLDFLMTNMETQTDDLFISGLGLSDIETQTPAENDSLDTLVTTETQTNMQSLVHEENDLTLFTDMQTQTQFNVVEFSSNDLTDSHTQTNFELFSL
ncbi:uncharacterized protein LOC124133981 [Haliotis rufescens]|uniref:uncharacterized protein LOC124133981 n=1 Tax=Haliotis rufescens TaxID=6454 RepID=UPI00201EFC23|nr:uncharacterized protein LOC124133981 [Haliotis rufescens]